MTIPTRNRPAFVRRAVASALAQDDVTVEVIVVDDASDEPLPVLDDPRVLVHRRAERGGQARARNEGLARARGHWIAFLDDDDLWAPQRLRTQLDAMDADAGFGYCAVVLIDAERHALGTFPAPLPETLRAGLRRACLIPGPSSVVVRADLLRELGGFRDDLAPVEDWDLWLRLADAAPASASGELLVGYMVHSENAHVRDPRRVISRFDLLAREHGLRDASRPFFAWLAKENRAAGHRRQAAEVALRSAWRHRSPADAGAALSALLHRPAPREVLAPRRLAPAWLDLYREPA